HPSVVPAHSASLRAFTPVFDGLWTRVNALMLGIHNHSLWNMGPRFRGDERIKSFSGITTGYDRGFHSRARFCASASWSDDISPATVSRFLTAAVRLRVSLAGKRAAAGLNHMCASTAFCVTPSPAA